MASAEDTWPDPADRTQASEVPGVLGAVRRLSLDADCRTLRLVFACVRRRELRPEHRLVHGDRTTDEPPASPIVDLVVEVSCRCCPPLCCPRRSLTSWPTPARSPAARAGASAGGPATAGGAGGVAGRAATGHRRRRGSVHHSAGRLRHQRRRAGAARRRLHPVVAPRRPRHGRRRSLRTGPDRPHRRRPARRTRRRPGGRTTDAATQQRVPRQSAVTCRMSICARSTAPPGPCHPRPAPTASTS